MPEWLEGFYCDCCMSLLIFITGTIAAILLTLSIVFFLEVALAHLPARQLKRSDRLPNTIVIVPAHNEGENLRPTLDDLLAAQWPGMEVLVVADNCDDDTAAISREYNVNTIERNNPDQRGKGYALQYGIDHVRSKPPEFVIFVDADSRFKPDTLRNLVQAAAMAQRPVQSLYKMNVPAEAPSKARISQFAWTVMNEVRMRGLSRFANVTRFTGVGLAASWPVISSFRFGSDAITEDHELTFELAKRRLAPVFDPTLLIESDFPIGTEAEISQRARWERGSLNVLTKRGVSGLFSGTVTGNIQLAAISLDALLPPLVLFAGLLAGAAMFSSILALMGAVWPFLLILPGCLLFGLAIVLSWMRFGRDELTLKDIGSIAVFLSDKLKIHGSAGRKSSKQWVRTERSKKSKN